MARRIGALSDQLGLLHFADVARALAEVLKSEDRNAAHALSARLSRIGDASFPQVVAFAGGHAG